MADYGDLRPTMHTGRSVGERNSRFGHYRSGIQCKLGDIEGNEWIKLAEGAIEENGDVAEFDRLKAFIKENISWLKNERQLHQYTLELFVDGMHKDPAWWGYGDFGTEKGGEG